MAKQPTVEQLDQLAQDLRETAKRALFQNVRQLASEMAPAAEKLADDLREYKKLTLR